jgi:hypothetical protein
MTRPNPTITPDQFTPKPRQPDIFTEARQLKNRLDALDRKKAEAIAEASEGARKLVEALSQVPGGLATLDPQEGDDEGPVSE